MKQAFFYENQYYLLPKDIPDVDALVKQYGDGTPFTVQLLTEKDCMPPYFASDAIKRRKLRLKPNAPLYPVEVEVLTRKEYNARLRALVSSYCEGCPGFTPLDDSEESLDGHHAEIALSGECFLRAEHLSEARDYACQDDWFSELVSGFGESGLEALIDEGREEEAEERLAELLYRTCIRMIPPIWLSKTEKGAYRLVTTSLYDEHDAILCEHLFGMLAKAYPEWEFRSSIPKGYFVRDAARPLGISYTTEGYKAEGLHLTVYTEEEKAYGAYFWIAGLLGEAELHTAVQEYTTENWKAEEPLPTNVTAPESIANIVKLTLLEVPDEEILYPTVREFSAEHRGENGEAPEMYYEMIRTIHYCVDFFHPARHGKRPAEVWEEPSIIGTQGLPLFRLVFRDPAFTSPENAMSAGLLPAANDVRHALAELILIFGQTLGAGAFEVSGVVLNLTKLLYALRRLDPIFRVLPAELYLYTPSHTSGGHYALGYAMKRLSSEEALWEAFSEDED